MTSSRLPDDTQANLDSIAWLREISLDPDRAEPLYQQLFTRIRSAILAGDRFVAGTRLPATRWLAQRLGVSRNTVVLAYQRLQEDGYVRGMAGGGTVVAVPAKRGEQAGGPAERPAAAGNALGLPNSAFPVGVPPIEEFPTALWATLTARRLRVGGERILLGAEQAGHRQLREAIAAYLGVIRGLRVGPDRIVVTAGVDAGLDVLGRVLAGPGDSVWCEEPGYPVARDVLTRLGRRPCPVPVDAEGLDVAAGIATAPDATMAVLSAARQLPLGVPLSAGRRRALLAHAVERGMWLVEHENDAAFLHPDAPRPLLSDDRYGRVAYVGTFNTVLFPQLHVGYCVLPAELVGPVGQALCESAADVSALTQEVLADFLDHHRFARFLQRVRTACARRRRTLSEALDRLPNADLELLGPPGDGSYLGVVLPGLEDEAALIAEARRVSLHLTPLARYYAGTPDRAGFLLGCAGVRDEAIAPAIRLLGPLLSRPSRRVADRAARSKPAPPARPE